MWTLSHRARIVLLLAEGLFNTQIEMAVSVTD